MFSKMKKLLRHSIYTDKVLIYLAEIKELLMLNLSMNHVQNNTQLFSIGEIDDQLGR